MKRLGSFFLFAWAVSLNAATAPAGFPFADETLAYSVKWPSGLSLGEASLTAQRSGGQWQFNLKLSASAPAYSVRDNYHSSAGLDLCAAVFERNTSHGSRKAVDTTTFSGGVAVRQTASGGGKTEMPAESCAHDALTFLFFARHELGQGKVPPAQRIFFGPDYRIALQYAGLQTIKVADAPVQADRVVCTVTTRQPQPYTFEVYFARDAARTPLLVRVPFALGAFSMELVR